MKTNNISILYVEDEENIQKQLTRFISRFCEQLYLAKNGKEGLEIYKEHKPDIIISDIRMPVMNGIEMVREIKKIDPKQMIIFISAHSESDYLFDAINMQVDGYILKPVDLSVLEEKIKNLIKIHENLQASERLSESEERFRKIADNSHIGIFIYKEKYIYVNKTFCQLTGYTQDELYSMHPWELIEPSLQEPFKEVVNKRLKGEEFYKEYNDIRIFTKDKQHKVFRASASTVHIAGSYAGLGTILEITDLIRTQEKLIMYEQAIEQMDEMVRISKPNGEIIFVNKAVSEHTGYTQEELLKTDNSIFKSGKHDEKFYQNLWQTILAGGIYRDTFINKKKNGQLYYEDQTITPIYDINSKEIKYFVSTGKDITENIKMLKELETLATVDSLTGIANRYMTNQALNDEIARAKRYDDSFALLMLDIDYFKEINDTYGHDIGDIVLQELSSVVASSIRESDIFGRWGGEEFLLIAPKITREDAIKLAEKLRHTVDIHNFSDVKNVTVSIGVTLYSKDYDKEMLLKKVDDALYKSKNSGRNKVSFI
jgi:diguanylate cyclase (GGDEF)-like protein/PAS domain S-box-containing protein